MVSGVAAVAAVGPAAVSQGVTYYVSQTGSDSAAGTDSSHPWASVAKVDGTAFSPGDQILFQRGATWAGSLDASSSGTTAAPITYGAYGVSTAAAPTFTGSDLLASSAFSLVSGTTYATSTSTVNWVFDNHVFTHEAQDVLTQAGVANPTAAQNLSYVESTSNSFYYNAGNSNLYVNLGTNNLAGQTITAARRDDAVSSNAQSNLVFQDLNATETAKDDAGYAFRIQNSANVIVQNCTASDAGKHHFGIIDSTNVTARNLVASYSSPDLGFGGASAYVFFNDNTSGSANDYNATGTFSNIKFVDNNSGYATFISHGGANAIGSLNISNIQTPYGEGAAIYSTGSGEKVVVNGGNLNNSELGVDSDNSVVNNLTLTGDNAQVAINGNHSVVQNILAENVRPSVYVGHNGPIVVSGTDDTVRFNTLLVQPAYYGPAPAVSVMGDQTGAQLYGNIVSSSEATRLFGSNGSVLAGDNLYSTGIGFAENQSSADVTLAQWQADTGQDLDSISGDATFSSDYSLAAGSLGVGLYDQSLDPTLVDANALLGPANADGSYNAGLNLAATAVPEPATVATLAGAITLFGNQRRARKRRS